MWVSPDVEVTFHATLSFDRVHVILKIITRTRMLKGGGSGLTLCLLWVCPLLNPLRRMRTPLLNPLRRMSRQTKVRARVGSLSLMPLLKFLLVLTPRLPFNALLLHPPPWLEVQTPLLLPLHPIL